MHVYIHIYTYTHIYREHGCNTPPGIPEKHFLAVAAGGARRATQPQVTLYLRGMGLADRPILPATPGAAFQHAPRAYGAQPCQC